MSRSSIGAVNPSLRNAISNAVSKKVFSSFEDAVQQSGVVYSKYSRPSKYPNKDSILKRLRELNDSGVIMADSHIRHADGTSWNRIHNKRIFSSWDLAVRESGLTPIKAPRGYCVDGTKVSKSHRIRIPKEGERLSYFIGILMGDGWIVKSRVGCEACDKEMVDNFSRMGNRLFGITPHRYERIRKIEGYGPCRKLFSSLFFSTEMSQFMVDQMGKGKDKKIPSWIVNGSPNIKRAFISAFFDCEGCVSKNRKVITITQKNKDVLDSIQNILKETFDITSHISNAGAVYNLNICGKGDKNNFHSSFQCCIRRKQRRLKDGFEKGWHL